MPSSLTKVQKRITKKKGAAKVHALHEDSRDAMRIRRASARDDRVARLSAVREKANEAHMLRVLFLQDRIPDPIHPLDDSDIHDAVKEHLARDDDILADLKAERRAGRPPSTKQTLLEQQQAVERNEYDSGYWMPDMKSEANMAMLRDWRGDWAGLGRVKFVRVAKSGAIKESAFPPKGAA